MRRLGAGERPSGERPVGRGDEQPAGEHPGQRRDEQAEHHVGVADEQPDHDRRRRVHGEHRPAARRPRRGRHVRVPDDLEHGVHRELARGKDAQYPGDAATRVGDTDDQSREQREQDEQQPQVGQRAAARDVRDTRDQRCGRRHRHAPGPAKRAGPPRVHPGLPGTRRDTAAVAARGTRDRSTGPGAAPHDRNGNR